MTVSVVSPADLVRTYAGDGATTAFSYPVKFWDDAEIVVYLREDGDDTLQTITTHYTVTGEGEAGGGTITFVTAPTADQTVVIYRDVQKKQTVDLSDGGRNSAGSVESQLDRLAHVTQDLGERAGRAVKVPPGETAPLLKGGDGLEGETLVFDADGNLVPGADQSEIEAAQGYAAAAGVSKTAAETAEANAEAARDVTLSAVPNSFPLTRTALKALDTATITSAYLKESGREGQFLWDSSDLSADVTVDTGEGRYVPPTSDATGASGAWARVRQHFIDAAEFGCVGDGVTDATAEVQAAIDVAEVEGEVLVFRPGTFKVSSAISATGSVKIRGAGWQGDQGWGYNGGSGSANPTIQSTGHRGTAFVCGDHTFLSIVSNDACILEGFQVVYPSGSSASVRAIKIAAGATATGGDIDANAQTIIRGIMTIKASIALEMVDCLSFHVTENRFLYNIIGGARFNNPSWPNFQIGHFSRNEVWGGSGNLLEMMAGGEVRVMDNKFNAGGASSVGIMFSGAVAGVSNMEPMFVVGNSLEGQNTGIMWNTGNADQSSTQIVVASNQIWAGTEALRINPGVSGSPWIIGASVTGNVFVINGGTGVGPIATVGGLRSAVFSGNLFQLTSGTGTALAFGVNIDAGTVKFCNNRYGTGITKPSFSTPSIPASATALENTSNFVIEVNVNGGTVTAIAVNGATQSTTSNRSFMLEPGDTITLTYSVAPTWVWRVVNP